MRRWYRSHEYAESRVLLNACPVAMLAGVGNLCDGWMFLFFFGLRSSSRTGSSPGLTAASPTARSAPQPPPRAPRSGPGPTWRGQPRTPQARARVWCPHRQWGGRAGRLRLWTTWGRGRCGNFDNVLYICLFWTRLSHTTPRTPCGVLCSVPVLMGC